MGSSNFPTFDPLNATEEEMRDMVIGYREASHLERPPTDASVAYEHGWRMRRNDMAGVVDDDQRELVRRLREERGG